MSTKKLVFVYMILAIIYLYTYIYIINCYANEIYRNLFQLKAMSYQYLIDLLNQWADCFQVLILQFLSYSQ